MEAADNYNISLLEQTHFVWGEALNGVFTGWLYDYPPH